VPSPNRSAPPLRILDAAAAEERVRSRQSWAELWSALAREATPNEPETRDESDEKATVEDEESAA
jgi:hypothetical protein